MKTKILLGLLIGIIVLGFRYFFLYQQYDSYTTDFDYEVIYDMSHNNVWSPKDTGFYGFSKFTNLLNQYGIYVSENTYPLDRVLEFVKDNVNTKVLILNVAKYQKYSEPEVNQIFTFVRDGGKLLIFGEHDNMYSSSDFQNQILSKFNIYLENNSVGNLNINYRKSYSEKFQLKQVYHQLASGIFYDTNNIENTVLLRDTDSNQVIALGTKSGKGRVIVISDSELFWNENNGLGIEKGDNQQFVIKCMEWLFQTTLKKKIIETCNCYKLPIENRKIVYWEGSGTIDNFWDSHTILRNKLYEHGYISCKGNCYHYDIKIISSPLKKVPYQARKTLLMLDSYDELDKDFFWDRYHLKQGYENRKHPLSEWQKKLSFHIPACYLSYRSENVFITNTIQKDTYIPLHRSTYIDILESKLLPVYSIDGKDLYCKKQHLGMNSEIEIVENKKQYDIMVKNKDVLILSDRKLLSDYNSDLDIYTILTDHFLNWLSE